MKTIFILMDSLNRHLLNAYGSSSIHTPNIDRLASRGIVFDRHFSGSLPCMPARREMWTGRVGFLESPWCPLQPYDECLVRELRQQRGVYSHLITDHYHYFELKGLGYHTPFNTWEFIRGQEGDHWHASVKDPHIPAHLGKNWRQDWVNRTFMDSEQDLEHPTPKSFNRAIHFLENNHDQDHWHLHLEVFDPHEPFFTPKKYLEMYNDTWHGRSLFDWPHYAPVDPDTEGEEGVAHIRNRYAATVTMADVWLGKLLDKMDELDLWKDTAVVLTTDHGYLLGDHGYWAKNYTFDYNELVHIPLIAYYPGAQNNGKRVQALTTTIDLMPTFLELHGAKPSQHVQGKSLVHLMNRDEEHHDAVMYGYFGKDVNITDGKYTYCRQPTEGSKLYNHTSFPIGAIAEPELYANAEVGRFLERTQLAVYRVAVDSKRHHNAPEYHLLYDIVNDPGQKSPIRDGQLEGQFVIKLKEILERYDAPKCQFARLEL